MKIMKTTTYNLSPEEKTGIFISRYRDLSYSSPDQTVLLEEIPETPITYPTVENAKDVEIEYENPYDETIEPPEEEKEKTSPKMNQVNLGYFDKIFMGTLPEHYIKAADGELGLYKNKPDPKTMLRNVLLRAQKYNPNKVTQEIESLNFTDDDERYLKLLQYLEGGSDYKIVNSAGYRGLYQFGKDALKSIKMKLEDYMLSSANQHTAALKLKDFNLNTLGLNKYVGKIIGGIKLTENGLAAGLHLGGAGSVKKFVESNGKLVAVDGNNVPITAYLSIFR